jgi:hypothetical protein
VLLSTLLWWRRQPDRPLACAPRSRWLGASGPLASYGKRFSFNGFDAFGKVWG